MVGQRLCGETEREQCAPPDCLQAPGSCDAPVLVSPGRAPSSTLNKRLTPYSFHEIMIKYRKTAGSERTPLSTTFSLRLARSRGLSSYDF